MNATSPGTSSSVLKLTEIVVGDRDRTELGDIAELAQSIESLGLLHPVVVTGDGDLIAGDRRLAAVQSLGWTEVAVTIVDLTTAEQVLKAEMEENTCRKGLTPVEASRARQRRARLLAPKAAQRKGQAKGKPRGAKAEPVSSSNLDEEKPATARATRKASSAGTGYSGSTLDKVDTIRAAAERGVIRRGKEEVPAPDEVVDVAKKALADVSKTGAAIDRSAKDVAAAIEKFATEDPDMIRARFRKSYFAALTKHLDLAQIDAERIAGYLDEDEMDRLRGCLKTITQWAAKVESFRRPGLRIVGGQSS